MATAEKLILEFQWKFIEQNVPPCSSNRVKAEPCLVKDEREHKYKILDENIAYMNIYDTTHENRNPPEAFIELKGKFQNCKRMREVVDNFDMNFIKKFNIEATYHMIFFFQKKGHIYYALDACYSARQNTA